MFDHYAPYAKNEVVWVVHELVRHEPVKEVRKW
jgi:hypothetical protein